MHMIRNSDDTGGAGMSLREQLLKAGLVNKKQAKKAENQSRQQEHNAKKNKSAALELESQREEELRLIEQQRLEKQQQDLELNRQRERIRIDRENVLRCRQLMNSNGLNERSAQERYYFLEAGRYVRKIQVTAWQREMLARGRLAIGRAYEHLDDFLILPYDVAQTVLQLNPEMVLTLHSAISDDVEVSDAE
jgi:uncharacterized protein